MDDFGLSTGSLCMIGYLILYLGYPLLEKTEKCQHCQYVDDAVEWVCRFAEKPAFQLTEFLYKIFILMSCNKGQKLPYVWLETLITGVIPRGGLLMAFACVLSACLLLLFNSSAAMLVTSNGDTWVISSLKVAMFLGIGVFSLRLLTIPLTLLTNPCKALHELVHTPHTPLASEKRYYWWGVGLFTVIFCSRMFIVSRHNLEHTHTNFIHNETQLKFGDLELQRGDDTPDNLHVKMQQDSRHSYRSCTMRWGSLSAVDHALLAKMAYFDPIYGDESEKENMKTMLDFVFPDYEAVLVENWDDNHIRRKQLQNPDTFSKYYQIDFHKYKHTVIAVQGTDFSDLIDVFSDVRLWLVSCLLDVAQKILFPFQLIKARSRVKFQWLLDYFQSHITLEEKEVRAGHVCVRVCVCVCVLHMDYLTKQNLDPYVIY